MYENVGERNITLSLASLTTSKAARDAIDAMVHGEVVCKFDVFDVGTRLAATLVMGVAPGNAMGVDALMMRVVAIFGEVTVGFTTHALGENDAVLQSVVCLLAPNTKLLDRGI